MTERRPEQPYTVAIGGVGGSGTRIGAALLQILGYYIGGDLNEALDNLWFTLLFKRRSILVECSPDLCTLISLFFSRMSGETNFNNEQRARVLRLVDDVRLQHSRDWLRQRVDTFVNGGRLRNVGQPWGWKEPNTHIVIDRFLEFQPGLRYIHFTRHPIDMALSINQNQLQNWGPILLNRDVASAPRQSLSYWCAAHRRMDLVMQRWPNRTMTVDFDELRNNPAEQCGLVAHFLGAATPDDFHAKLGALIDLDRPSGGRFKPADLTQFVPDDISYVRALGYVV